MTFSAAAIYGWRPSAVAVIVRRITFYLRLPAAAPVSDGSVTLAGSIYGPFSSRDYNLALTAHDLPVQSLVAFLRHAKQGVADDLIAAGRLNGDLKLERSVNARSSDSVWEGRGEASGVELGSKFNKTELLLGDVPLVVSAGAHPKSASRDGSPQRRALKSVHSI